MVKWSMAEHTEDEIRDAILNKPELVCFTYICRYSQMSPEFIENELIVLSTGLFENHPEWYTENNIELVREILYIEPTRERVTYQNNIKHNKTKVVKNADEIFVEVCSKWKGPIRSKVDWWQIGGYQRNLNKEFLNKFGPKIKEAKYKSNRPEDNLREIDEL